MSRRNSARNKPEMIGAHTPKPIVRRRRRFNQTAAAAEFNDAFDTWAKRHGRTHLGYQRDAFAR